MTIEEWESMQWARSGNSLMSARRKVVGMAAPPPGAVSVFVDEDTGEIHTYPVISLVQSEVYLRDLDPDTHREIGRNIVVEYRLDCYSDAYFEEEGTIDSDAVNWLGIALSDAAARDEKRGFLSAAQAWVEQRKRARQGSKPA